MGRVNLSLALIQLRIELEGEAVLLLLVLEQGKVRCCRVGEHLDVVWLLLLELIPRGSSGA